MTRRLYGRLLSALGGAALLLFAAQAPAGISGTDHDLSANGWSGGQICVVCHTPHNAKAYEPLWNHQVTASTFTLYSSSTLNTTVGQPTGVSKLCLSCHDGTVAVDNFGTVTTGTTFVSGDHSLGTDLSNDHPVSFTYDSALATADGKLVTPASTSQVVAGIPLFSAKLECASCHNVHDNTVSPFLRTSNANSALCLKCHNK